MIKVEFARQRAFPAISPASPDGFAGRGGQKYKLPGKVEREGMAD